MALQLLTMIPPKQLEHYDGLIRYQTSLATLIAFQEAGNTRGYLFLTKNGRYFAQAETETYNWIRPISLNDAFFMYRHPTWIHLVPFSDAFPNLQVEDA